MSMLTTRDALNKELFGESDSSLQQFYKIAKGETIWKLDEHAKSQIV
jgi:hypothetical protein